MNLRLIPLLLCTSLLSSCASFDAMTFRRADVSGIEGSKTALMLVKGAESADAIHLAFDRFAPEVKVEDALKGRCAVGQRVGPATADAGATAIVGAAVAQVVYTLLSDYQQRRIEGIVASAKASYSATLVEQPSSISEARCVVMFRYKEIAGKPNQLGLLMVAELIPAGAPKKDEKGKEKPSPASPDGLADAFTFRPVFVLMPNSVAVTKASDKPTTSLSIAVSVKAIGVPEGGVHRLLAAGEGVTTVPAVQLGSASPRCVKGECKASDLIPYPLKRGSLSLTLAIAEQGNTGFDDKAALAELAAVKAALGPAIGEAVKVKLSESE